MIIERPLNFDIEQIAKSGQCFRIIETRDKVYRAITGDHYVEIKHLGDDSLSCLLYTSPSPRDTR